MMSSANKSWGMKGADPSPAQEFKVLEMCEGRFDATTWRGWSGSPEASWSLAIT